MLRLLREVSASAMYFIFPPLSWLPSVTRGNAVSDIVSGIIVGVMLLPSSLSYASLAQLPLEYGLFTALLSTLTYSMFGQTPALSVGPCAEITSLMLSMSGGASSTMTRPVFFATVATQVGLLSLFLSLIQGGKVIKTLLAKCVSDGYISAAGIVVVISQIKVMFNVSAPAAFVITESIANTISAMRGATVHSLYSFLLFLAYFRILSEFGKLLGCQDGCRISFSYLL